MQINLIAAVSQNRVIGFNNKLPWKLPNDLLYFKNQTYGMPVIMGRKTFQSLQGKPLQGRFNMVLTQQQGLHTAAAIVYTFSDALQIAASQGYKQVFVIGGQTIFEQTIGQAHRLFITQVHETIQGDVFFPAVDTNVWQLATCQHFLKDSRHLYDYSFEVWDRR